MTHLRFPVTGLCLCLMLAIASSATQKTGIVYKVDVVSHIDTFVAPTYLPTCSAQTPEGAYGAVFPRHDPCATVTTSTGYRLTDDIRFLVPTNRSGQTISVQLRGQDVIGKVGIMHESELITIDPPFTPPTSGGFTLHLDVDNLPIWKLTHHLGGKRTVIVGYISLGDLVYSPNP